LRVRTHRDQLLKDADVQKVKENSEKTHILEQKTINKSRRERIATLESEISRLKLCMAGNSGEMGLVEFFKSQSISDSTSKTSDVYLNPFSFVSSELQRVSKEKDVLLDSLSAGDVSYLIL
jgi:uncharacterized small protein (DUF1192 family)